jgi:heme/copper-type cytochrome/quinol oxidase subunit 2
MTMSFAFDAMTTKLERTPGERPRIVKKTEKEIVDDTVIGLIYCAILIVLILFTISIHFLFSHMRKNDKIKVIKKPK